MHAFRRGAVVLALTFGLVLGSCTDVEVRDSHPTSPRVTVGNRGHHASRAASTTTPPDVHGALTALAHVIRVMFVSTTTTAPVPVADVVTPRPQSTPTPITGTGEVNGFPCGGPLPPCFVLARESGGNPAIVEGHGSPFSHASGLWQFMPGTWNHYAGFPYAAAAPWQVQNAKAREVWAGGAGCSHWSAC